MLNSKGDKALKCRSVAVLRLKCLSAVAATGVVPETSKMFFVAATGGRGRYRHHINRMIMRLSNLNQAVA